MSRATAPQVSFADWELMHQGSTLDPLLAQIAALLDQEEEIIGRIRLDLERGLKRPAMGRGGLTPAQVLRSLVLMRVKSWDYRELRERIADGYSLRQFTHFYAQAVPQHCAFNRAFNRLTSESLRYINELIVQTAVALGLEDGDRLRVDTTVVQSEVHHPTDNTLLADAVRVITRLVRRVGEIVPRAASLFHNRNRSAKRRSQEIQRMTSRERQTRQTRKYRELIEIAQEVVQSARVVLNESQKGTVSDVLEAAKLQGLRQEIEHHCQLGDKVIDQTHRRVLEGEKVPNAEKVFSIFEPHTDLIKRGKVWTPEEFGHKVFLAESEQGLITQYEVLKGNPHDQDHVEVSLEHHHDTFGHAPHCYAADRGFQSPDNEKACNSMESSRFPFRNVAARKLPSAPHTRRPQSSNKPSAFAPALRGAFLCSSVAVV